MRLNSVRIRATILMIVASFVLVSNTGCTSIRSPFVDYSVDLAKWKNANSSIIYDKDGAKIGEVYGKEKHEWVNLAELPNYLKMAFVVTEDKRFYEHNGIDPKGIARALYKDIEAGRAVEGASTITQQLAKNLFLSSEKTIAISLEQKYSKDEILEMYLNVIYFGHGANGIQSAAQTYFGKDAKHLTIAEAALLAALPKAPSTYSPTNNPDVAKERRSVVLALMRQNNIISDGQEKEANAEEIKLRSQSQQQEPYQAYIDYVVIEAASLYRISEDELYQGGYQIYTNLDTATQNAMNRAVKRVRFREDENDQAVEVGIVSIDPKEGGRLAKIYAERKKRYLIVYE